MGEDRLAHTASRGRATPMLLMPLSLHRAAVLVAVVLACCLTGQGRPQQHWRHLVARSGQHGAEAWHAGDGREVPRLSAPAMHRRARASLAALHRNGGHGAAAAVDDDVGVTGRVDQGHQRQRRRSILASRRPSSPPRPPPRAPPSPPLPPAPDYSLPAPEDPALPVSLSVAARFPPVRWRHDLLLYNRVPKTGSTTMQALLDELGPRNGFATVHSNHPHTAPRYKESAHVRFAHPQPRLEELLRFADYHQELPGKMRRPVAVDHHWPWVNFTAARKRQPLYFNTLRDPLSRAASAYTYLRYGPRDPDSRAKILRLFGNLTLDGCAKLYRKCGCEGGCARARDLRCTKHKCADLFMSFHDGAQFMFFW